MSENARVTKAAGVVGAATLLSRIFGFIRDVVVAWFFGAGLSSDAFFVAFRIPNLLRRLFAEGSLSIAFIPVFTEYLQTQGKDEAFHLARAAMRLLALILFAVTILGIIFSPIIIRVIAPGFTDPPEKFALTVMLTRIMFPYCFFVCLVALCMGILNTLGHFAAPAVSPVLLNIAIILSALLISPRLQEPITGIAIGVLIGGVLQLAIQIPFLIKKGIYLKTEARETKSWREYFYHPGLKKIGILMLPAVFGATVYQVNILVGTLLASLLPEGSVSYLYYADRLVEFPLGIFAISAATAVLPSLSRQAAAQDFDALRHTFSYSMKLVFFITIPAMIGLIVLREPIVGLLFRRGAFDAQSTEMTAYALLYYSVGLWAFSAVRIVVSTFYALQDTKTPVRIAVISILANIFLSIILMGPLKHGGLALATSLASMLNLFLLVRALKVRLGSLEWKSILTSAVKSLICAAAMGAAVWALAFLIIPADGKNLIVLFSGLLISIVSGLIFYAFFSFLLKSQEFEKVLATVRRGIK
jgi:putative peptidoglycan lipid II flippase